MFRTKLRTLPHVRTKYKFDNSAFPTWQSIKKSSTVSDPNKGGAGKLIAKLLGLGAVAGGGTIGYAYFDPSFRKLVEDKVPLSDVAFLYTIDRFKHDDNSAKSITPAKDSLADASLMKKKLDRASEVKGQISHATPKEALQNESVQEKKLVDKTPVIVQEKNIIEDKINEQQEIAKLERKLAAEEVKFNRKNEELQKIISELSEKLDNQVEAAISAQKQASNAIRQHADKLNKLLDESEGNLDEVEWSEVTVANEKKQESVQKSRHEVNSASEVIVQLRNVIEEARNDKNTAANKCLFKGEDAVESSLTKLARSEKQLEDAQFKDKMALDYQSSLENAREKLQKELKAILPNINLVEHGNDLTKEENSQLIVHCWKQIDHLNKRMAKQQATEQSRIKEATMRQREEDESVSESALSMELARQSRELNISHQKKINEIKEQFDHELRQGLRRQLATHVEHVQECLRTQAKELEKEYQELVKDKVIEEKGKNEALLSDSFAKLNAIEDLLRSRADLDKASKKAKELWLACQMLKNTLKVGRLGEPGSDLNLKPLDQELNAIKKAAGEANPFVRTLVETIPEQALTRGVYTEEALRERFQKVERVCKRVAMIDETGGSLFKFFISYLQSFFILPPTVLTEAIENDEEIEPSELGTFDIISRVNLCLQQDNLIQALRYINLLKGEPRNVAEDWIKELRILLETRQIADTLTAHAAATSIQAYH